MTIARHDLQKGINQLSVLRVVVCEKSMDISLVIDDDYVDAVGISCKTRGGELDKILSEYVDILTEIEQGALVEGSIASALTAYKECVNLLKEQITNLSNDANTLCDNFITSVNEADDYLF